MADKEVKVAVVGGGHVAQIAHIPAYSSREGFRIHPDHEYEMEAFYDNTSQVDVDAMAVIYLYFNPLGDPDLRLATNLEAHDGIPPSWVAR